MKADAADLIKRQTIANIQNSIVSMDLRLADLPESSRKQYTCALTKADLDRTTAALDVIRSEVLAAFGE